jgi:hypothetical protein
MEEATDDGLANVLIRYYRAVYPEFAVFVVRDCGFDPLDVERKAFTLTKATFEEKYAGMGFACFEDIAADASRYAAAWGYIGGLSVYVKREKPEDPGVEISCIRFGYIYNLPEDIAPTPEQLADFHKEMCQGEARITLEEHEAVMRSTEAKIVRLQNAYKDAEERFRGITDGEARYVMFCTGLSKVIAQAWLELEAERERERARVY